MLVDTAYADKTRAAAVKALASYILSPDCAKTAGEALGFSVLNGEFKKKAEAQIAKIG
jgi:phosphate transport system substrate-binding protein